MTRIPLVAIASAAACLSALPAHALNTRTWISGKGVDQAGCGPIATPCRTLQFAHDTTSAGGEINVLDPAGYGAVTISKAINIINEGAGVAGALAPSGGAAITINAGTNDTVALRGLTVEGAGVGQNGVVFNSGAGLEIGDCTIRGFTSSGIALLPTRETIFTITNTVITRNALGIRYQAGNAYRGSRIAIDRVTTMNNTRGLQISTANTPAYFTITNSTFSGNSLDAMQMEGGLLFISADQSNFSNNTGDGIVVLSGTLNIGRSIFANNGNFDSTVGYGINNVVGSVQSYGDNRFSANRLGATAGPFSNAAMK